MSDFKMFSLGSNDKLAQDIAEKVGTPLGQIHCKQFSDGEQHVQFLENLRGRHIFLIQSTNPPAENWVTLFLAIDAARGASAKEITVVLPYFGYARQDRKSRSREPISARVFAIMLETLGVHRVLTMDFHSDVIGGFFHRTIVDFLYARPVFIAFFKDYFAEALERDDVVIVSPDAGGVIRAQSFAKRLMKNADLAIIHKEREIPNQVARMKLVGDVKDKIALIVDDMADTCGTLARAASLLTENGAREVYAAATHGLFSGEAKNVLDASSITKIFVTDTVASQKQLSDKVQVVSVGTIFADAISRIVSGESLSALFETE